MRFNSGFKGLNVLELLVKEICRVMRGTTRVANVVRDLKGIHSFELYRAKQNNAETYFSEVGY